MQITTRGYPVQFIQTHPENSYHFKRYVYKFHSPVTKLNYIAHADCHEHDFFAIKFYAKKDRHSEVKYSKIINKGDVSGILVTCAKIIPLLLEQYPKASFGFVGARTIDNRARKVEDYKNNQRYRLYRYHIPQLIGNTVFLHKSFRNASAYILLNRKWPDLSDLESNIKEVVIHNYPDLLNINL